MGQVRSAPVQNTSKYVPKGKKAFSLILGQSWNSRNVSLVKEKEDEACEWAVQNGEAHDGSSSFLSPQEEAMKDKHGVLPSDSF